MPSEFKARVGTLTFGLMLTASLGACVGSQSIEKQANLISQAGFSATTRYAVVSRKEQLHETASFSIAQELTPRIANIIEDSLGIEADALPGGPGTDWEAELLRARDATGWIKGSSYDDFMRRAGFDGYVLITLFESRRFAKEADDIRFFVTYNPVFHMFSLLEGDEKLKLMQEGQRGLISCDVQGKPDTSDPDITSDVNFELKDPPGCVNQIATRFATALDARLKIPR